MALVPGTRLGPFEVLAPLGAGGMGEVYRARDTRLGRDVAIKVLPQEVSSSLRSRARFEREARTVSQLNHPHICVLHDMGREGTVDYLVMELVVGETLSSRLAKSALTTGEVLEFGTQIAEALDSAHRAGVVHRDLKPGNIMLTATGVKLMDFGLALDTGPAGARSDDPAGATTTRSSPAGEPITAEGVLVGTLPYMAPEQLEGKHADSRSDVWALGCILYEMASGTPAFGSKSRAGLIASILKDEPRPLHDLSPLAPPALAHVIERCLTKEPRARWQSAGDVARELEWVSRSDAQSSGILLAQARKQRSKWRLAAVGAGPVIVMAIAAFVARHRPPELNPEMRTRAVDVPMTDVSFPGLSQDGRWIALPARDDHGVPGIYYMNATGGEVRPIAIDSSAYDVNYADISPDGSQVAYSVALGRLESDIRVVGTLGGAVRTLARDGECPRWSPDGQRIGYVRNSWASPSRAREFWTVRPDGTDRKLEFADSVSAHGGSYGFAWAPSGRSVAWLRSFEQATVTEIVIRDLDTGHERQLTHDRKVVDEIAWTPQDDILFTSNRGGATNVWMIHASGGQPVQVTRGAGPDLGIRTSADGRTLLYLLRQPLARIGWWDTVSGERGQVTREDQPFTSPCLPSPDGRSVLVSALDSDVLTEAKAIVVLNRDGSGRRTLVPSSLAPRAYCWSPDGKRIAWLGPRAAREDSSDVHIVDAVSGETTTSVVLPTQGKGRFWLAWPSPDSLLVIDEHGSFRFSLSTNRTSERSPDQIFEFPPHAPGWNVYLDRRPGGPHASLYVRYSDGRPDRRVMPFTWMAGQPSGRDFLYCWPDSLGLSRIDPASGRITPVPRVPSAVRKGMLVSPSRDGRVAFWFHEKSASKLVLVENLRK